MTISEMHASFKLELDKTSSLELPAYEPEEIDYWLNTSINKFVKTRYSGVNLKGESFEQSQKRIDDLRTLIKQEAIVCTRSTFRDNTFIATLTSLTDKYWFTLTEEAQIGYINELTNPMTPVASGSVDVSKIYKIVGGDIDHSGTTWSEGNFYTSINPTFNGTGHPVEAESSIEPVKEATADTFTKLLQNPYSEHILHYEKASPLRLFLGDTVELITDGTYDVIRYYIRFIKRPRKVNILTTAYITATADIKDGITYKVSTNTVTYNGSTYAINATFVGTSGVSTFTGTGTATAQTASCDLPENTHDEVVRLAVNMALENIEQPRYQSHMNEIVTME